MMSQHFYYIYGAFFQSRVDQSQPTGPSDQSEHFNTAIKIYFNFVMQHHTNLMFQENLIEIIIYIKSNLLIIYFSLS